MNEANVKKLPYNASLYIQEEDGKYVVYLELGGNTWYIEKDNKQEALKEFNNAVYRAKKEWKSV